MTARGRLFVFEGIDGCGKSTQAQRVAASIGARGTFEPGDTALGAALRAVVLDASVSMTPLAEAMVMAADRAQHVAEVIEPELAAGRDVVCDRFGGSTLAYQGYGRGVELDDLRRLVDVATGGLTADLTVLLDCAPAVARARRRARRAGPDRFEGADEAFADRVRSGFLDLAGSSKGWHVVDASRPPADVAAAVDALVAAARA